MLAIKPPGIGCGLCKRACHYCQLIAHGRSATTPAAAIDRATSACQRVVVTSLAMLESDVMRAALCSPTLLIIGEVVRLRESYESAATKACTTVALI